MQWRRRGRRSDDPSTAAPTEVKTSHPGVELLLSQRRLGRVKGPKELGVPRRGAPTPAAAATAHLTRFPGAVRRRGRLALVGDGRGRGAHFGEQRRGVSEGITPRTLEGTQSQPRQEASRGITRGLVLLLELLLMLQLDLLLVAQLSF